ncbi:MAG: signal peptidase II [Deltaproteobacteria bacterium]|nr:signal peptidase II [Deltaproteobacteria bacterium]
MVFIGAAITTFAIDQASKFLATRTLPTARRKRDRAWSLHQSVNREHPILRRRTSFLMLWIATVIVSIVWLRHLDSTSNPIACAALGTAIGGCAGNTFDRMLRGGVIDFIGFRRISLFNLADVAIVVGAGLLAHSYLTR